jgi:hypothetical protein
MPVAKTAVTNIPSQSLPGYIESAAPYREPEIGTIPLVGVTGAKLAEPVQCLAHTLLE